jgi:hypothetical protein
MPSVPGAIARYVYVSMSAADLEQFRRAVVELQMEATMRQTFRESVADRMHNTKIVLLCGVTLWLLDQGHPAIRFKRGCGMVFCRCGGIYRKGVVLSAGVGC